MKICVITGTRAEYGLLRKLMLGIKENKKLRLSTIVTGMHLSKKFGLTYKEIIKDGFKINKKINLNLSSDTTNGIIKSINKGTIGFANAYKRLKPDIILVLGDRYEIFAAVIAACFSKNTGTYPGLQSSIAWPVAFFLWAIPFAQFPIS